jgi:aspartokinase
VILDDYYLSKLLEKNVNSYDKFVKITIESFLKNNKVSQLSWLNGHNIPYLVLIKELLNTLNKNNTSSQVSLFNIDEASISDIIDFEEINYDNVLAYANKTETHNDIINQSNDSLVSFVKRTIKSNHSIILDIVDSLHHEYLMYIMISDNKKFKHFGIEYNEDLKNKSIDNMI